MSGTSLEKAVKPVWVKQLSRRSNFNYGTPNYPEKLCLCFHNRTVNIFFVGQQEPIIKRYAPNMNAFTTLSGVCFGENSKV